MKHLIFYVVMLFCVIAAKAELNTRINAENVDSIVIRTINWFSVSFGYYGIDRKAFDELYQFISTDSVFREKEGMSIDSIIIKDDLAKFLFCAIINNLPKDEPQDAMPTPDEIWKRCKGFEFNMGIMTGGFYNGDPLEIRGQIRIYLKDGNIITAYMSRTLIDIFNERYIAFNLSSFIWKYISYMHKQNVKTIKERILFPDYDYSYNPENILKIASADSIVISKKIGQEKWIKYQTINNIQYISKLGEDILHSTGTTTNINPQIKIEFYGASFCIPVFSQGELFELYGIVYKMPYNLEDYISRHFLNAPN